MLIWPKRAEHLKQKIFITYQNGEPVYNKEFLKAKIKYGDEVENCYDKKMLSFF